MSSSSKRSGPKGTGRGKRPKKEDKVRAPNMWYGGYFGGADASDDDEDIIIISIDFPVLGAVVG